MGKSKFGYKRERTPFVFTQEMAYVIGGADFQSDPKYQHFLQLCVQAFNHLRRQASLLQTLFVLLVSAGMPELLVKEDVSYMRDRLCLEMTDGEAGMDLLKQVQLSVESKSRRVDNFIHIVKHG